MRLIPEISSLGSRDGSGSGRGTGWGCGDGLGNGDGDGDGRGWGYGSGEGWGFGDGYGWGQGWGDGIDFGCGYGYGHGLVWKDPMRKVVQVHSTRTHRKEDGKMLIDFHVMSRLECGHDVNGYGPLELACSECGREALRAASSDT